MKISPAIVGATAGPLVQDIDARWLMAYAAGLGETAPEYLDTLRPDGIVPHPLFSVCYEWPLMLELRARAFADDVALRSVHATHDLLIHRRVRPGDRLRTTARVMAAESRAPGAYVRVRLDTVDAAGEPVTVTEYGSLYLGVACEGPLAGAGAPPAPPSPAGEDAPLGSCRPGGPRRPGRRLRRPRVARAVVGRGAAGGGDAGPRLFRMRAHLESDPHRPRGRASGRPARHHPSRDGHARPRRLGRPRAGGARGRRAGAPRHLPLRRHGAHALGAQGARPDRARGGGRALGRVRGAVGRGPTCRARRPSPARRLAEPRATGETSPSPRRREGPPGPPRRAP